MEKEYNMFYNANPKLFEYAKQMRHERATKVEKLLWEQLKGKQLDGHKFRRQHPMGNYIVDFYCHQQKLVIEIDGGYHSSKEQKALDEERTKEIERFNIKVIRFTNQEVEQEIEKVLEQIKKHLT